MVKLTSKVQKNMFERAKKRKKFWGRVPGLPSSTCVFSARRAPPPQFVSSSYDLVPKDNIIPPGFIGTVPTTLAWDNDEFSSRKGTTRITGGIIIQGDIGLPSTSEKREYSSEEISRCSIKRY